MNYMVHEHYLSKLLDGRIKERDLINISPLMIELNQTLEMDFSNISLIIFKFPDILKFDPYNIVKNLKEISLVFDIKMKEFHYLLIKNPYLLCVQAQTLIFKLNLVKTVFGCSLTHALHLVYFYPEFLFTTKEQILSQVKLLSQSFDDYGLALRSKLRNCPSLMFTNTQHIEDIRKYLMYNFTFSQAEVSKIFRNCPSVVTLKIESLNDLYNFYYPKYFIKRDFKEMITECPEFFKLTKEQFLNKLTEIKSVFEFNDKQACEFIRTNPNILFYSSFDDKVKGFKKLFISQEYLKRNPAVLTLPEISIPLKFILCRILGLDSQFSEVCEMDSNLFLSRFLFMQNYGNFDHSDLLLSGSEFEQKYHIPERILLLSYKLDYTIIENITTYYVSLSDKLSNWRDIVFPSFEQIWKYVNSQTYENKESLDYLKCREIYNISKDKYELFATLKSLHLDDNECVFLINKSSNLITSDKDNLLKLVELMKKYGLNLEQIIKLMFKAPSIFSISIRDFDLIINQIVQREKCLTREAVYFMF